MELEKIMEIRSRRNAFANLLGIRVTTLREGYAEAVMSLQPSLKNPMGGIHGGAIYTLADVACSFSVASYGENAVTTVSNFNFLSADQGAKAYTAKANTFKHGNTMSYTEVKVYSDRDRLLASGTFIHYSLRTPIAE